MRIIAGEAGGRRLKSIKGTTTRPTLDRVKEALFNILGQAVIEAEGLDLFAGFGNLGLEALSRGAESFIFVEKDYRNVKIIKDNIEICGFSKRAAVRTEDVFYYLRETDSKYDLIMMDPPYAKGFSRKALELITERDLLNNGGLIVVEHGRDEALDDYPGVEIIRNRSYGDTGITIYQQAGGRD